MSKAIIKQESNNKPLGNKRSYLSQSDVPAYSLEQALRIPRAIIENYAGGPVTPVQLAQVLQMTPSSGTFRMLTGAAIAYGLTSGGYNAAEIKLEKLAHQIIRPLEEGDDLAGMRDAFMKPRIIREFISKYNGAQVPRTDIAHNVLISFGIPADKTNEAFSLILEGGLTLGIITEIKGKHFVDIHNSNVSKVKPQTPNSLDDEEVEFDCFKENSLNIKTSSFEKSNLVVQIDSMKKKKVYITHGKDMSLVEPIRKLLKFGEMEAVVSVEKQSVSKPVPDKVMSEMRSCGAAIIHVDAEQHLVDKDANEQIVLNPNVLIEIGAAMALYGRRFILLVKDGIKLPSNLQGLYEVRYNGSQLSGEVTIKLLEAINDIKTQLLPEENI